MEIMIVNNYHLHYNLQYSINKRHYVKIYNKNKNKQMHTLKYWLVAFNVNYLELMDPIKMRLLILMKCMLLELINTLMVKSKKSILSALEN